MIEQYNQKLREAAAAPSLAVLTPTFNRASLLPRLYQSLCRQSAGNDFVWVIVDDGSTDETAELAARWRAEGRLPVFYLYQPNGGKHTALNTGIEFIHAMGARLVFIVDSDDWLTDDAAARIIETEKEYRGIRDRISGFSYLRADSQGVINGGKFPQDVLLGNYVDVRINRGLLGDKAEVYYTDILNRYRFPVFSGEKFLPEDAVWIRMAENYDMLHLNSVIYYCDYLEGGLTRTGRRMKVKSPEGMMYRSAMFLQNRRVNLRTRVKMMLLWHVYHCFWEQEQGHSGVDARCRVRRGALYYAAALPGRMLYCRWKRRWKG